MVQEVVATITGAADLWAVDVAETLREAEDQTVTIRRQGQDDTRTLPLAEAVDLLVADARSPGVA